MSSDELQQEASGLKAGIEEHRRKGLRSGGIERALPDGIVKEYDNRLKLVTTAVETQSATDNLARSNAFSANRAAQRTHYYQTVGRAYAEANAAATLERSPRRDFPADCAQRGRRGFYCRASPALMGIIERSDLTQAYRKASAMAGVPLPSSKEMTPEGVTQNAGKPIVRQGRDALRDKCGKWIEEAIMKHSSK